MSHFRKSLKKEVLGKTVEINAVVMDFIQPLKELPSTIKMESEKTERINAHDLFSLYTANVIKEDIVYAR